MRGKPQRTKRTVIRMGLIPAHAGKTFRRGRWGWAGGAHPRACGENRLRRTMSRGGYGSSPRMRGKPPSFAPRRTESGLIPAHAGKTTSAATCHNRNGAHPRACGENPRPLRSSVTSRGSSPRMRGKLPSDPEQLRKMGLIPAHAGKTSSAGAVL